ncbi:MAG: transcriptional repressor [Patescibacteria group bacterium]|jgi:Fe2+ or Zn2+ uptake regulation protein
MTKRQTQTKIAVSQYLANITKPVTIKDIYSAIKINNPSVAFSTAYRIIHQMEQQKEVIRIDWRERGSYYEPAHLEHHHHIVCNSCGLVIDVDHATINLNFHRIESLTHFIISEHSVEFRGLCEKCREKS